MSGTLHLSAERTRLALRPGRPARLTVEVHNSTDAADMVSIGIEVPGTAWVVAAQPVTRVSRAESVFIPVEVHVAPDVVAGEHEAVLRVTSSRSPEADGLLRVSLTVEPDPGLSITIDPSVVRGTHRVESEAKVTNTGNTPLRIALETLDPAGAVTCSATPSSLALEPGASAPTTITVSARRRALGGSIRRLVGIRAEGTSETSQVSTQVSTEEFLTFHHRGVATARMLALAVIGVVMAVLGGLFSLATLADADDAPTKTPASGFSLGGAASAPTGGVIGTIDARSDSSPVARARVTAIGTDRDGRAVELASTATDERGAYRFPSLPIGTHRLNVEAVGFAEQTDDLEVIVVPGEDTEVDPIELRGLDGEVLGAVTLADRSPGAAGPDEVTITSESVDDRLADPVTATPDERGLFTISGLSAPGRHRLTLTAPGHVSRTIDVELAAGQSLTVPQVSLPGEPGSIAGRVVDSSGRPVDGVAVRILGSGVELEAETDADGRYALAEVPAPDTFVVEFFLTGYERQSTAVRLEAGERRDAVNGTLLGTTAILSGRVLDAEGAGIPSATVTVRGEGWSTVTSSSSSTTAAGQVGTYRLAGVPVPGSYTVTVEADGYSTRSIEVVFVVAAPQTGMDVVLSVDTGAVSGTVSVDGLATGGLDVSLDDGRTSRRVVSATSPAGRYSFTGVRPGSYTLTVEGRGVETRILAIRVAAGGSVTVDVSTEAAD